MKERKVREAFAIEERKPAMNRDMGVEKSRTWCCVNNPSTRHNFTRDKLTGCTPTLFKTHKQREQPREEREVLRKTNGRVHPGHLRWPALVVCDDVTCPSGESVTGEQIRKGGGGICDWGTDQKKRGGGSSADQVQTKKAAVTPVYSPALCLDGVAATAWLSLDDLGDRVPPLGTWVLHTDNCAGGKD